MLISSSKLFLFSNEVHLNSDVRLLLELYCVVVIKNVAFFTILGEINSGIHMYQFTFEALQTFTLLFSDVVMVSDLNKNFGGSTDLGKKGTDRRICMPLFTPLH